MTRAILFSLFLLYSLCMGGCSLHTGVEKLYKTETPLEVEIILPKNMLPNELETMKVVLTQNGKQIQDADFVHFEISKQDGSIQYGMETATEGEDGSYSVSKVFEQEGLYIIKVHASSGGSIVVPRKLFVVGQASAEELQALQDGSQKQEGDSGHHH